MPPPRRVRDPDLEASSSEDERENRTRKEGETSAPLASADAAEEARTSTSKNDGGGGGGGRRGGGGAAELSREWEARRARFFNVREGPQFFFYSHKRAARGKGRQEGDTRGEDSLSLSKPFFLAHKKKTKMKKINNRLDTARASRPGTSGPCSLPSTRPSARGCRWASGGGSPPGPPRPPEGRRKLRQRQRRRRRRRRRRETLRLLLLLRPGRRRQGARRRPCSPLRRRRTGSSCGRTERRQQQKEKEEEGELWPQGPSPSRRWRRQESSPAWGSPPLLLLFLRLVLRPCLPRWRS